MNSTLLERLRSFQIPAATPIPPDAHVVARLTGIDFEGILESPELGFARPFDARFAKFVVQTASHLLGGDACGRFAYAEVSELSLLLDRRLQGERWSDVSALQNYLVALSSTKLSALVDAEAIFACQMFAFNTPELAVAYFAWRQQEADVTALDRYCTHVLAKERSVEEIAKLLEGLGSEEKEEILRQNQIEYSDAPSWQRCGAGVSLADDGRVVVDASLPRGADYPPYLQRYLD